MTEENIGNHTSDEYKVVHGIRARFFEVTASNGEVLTAYCRLTGSEGQELTEDIGHMEMVLCLHDILAQLKSRVNKAVRGGNSLLVSDVLTALFAFTDFLVDTTTDFDAKLKAMPIA